MFERRLKLLLVLLLGILVLLAVRAAQFQIVEREQWQRQAVSSLEQHDLVDTTRGTIFDYRGRAIAIDAPCVDAAVDYRAVLDPPDDAWVKAVARARLASPNAGLTRSERVARLPAEMEAVKRDVASMWDLLGKLAERDGGTAASVVEQRGRILQMVEARKRAVWLSSYEKAMTRWEKSNRPAWVRRFLIGDDADKPTLEKFEIEVGEQRLAHAVLKDISPEVSNYLEKNLASLPGLVIQRSTTRTYPFNEAGAHVIGSLAKVSRKDLEKDPAAGDELREYHNADFIGRTGLEALYESDLRGTRGVRTHLARQTEILSETPGKPGRDVTATIDIALEQRIQDLFRAGTPSTDNKPVHGAAIVLDVATNEVRAMASYPSFDPNTLDVDLPRLNGDELNHPMLNRATMIALEPGSTVKPMVGLSAITAGVLRADEGILCDGYLTLNGHRYSFGKCWTRTEFHRTHMELQNPPASPYLQYPDAIQRSCNVFFENCADRLGLDALSNWMTRFGLGRPTGIGLPEVRGQVPNQFPLAGADLKSTTWFGGIGQSQVQASPIQIANMCAAIARDGVWMKPKLSSSEPDERVDLGLNPEAVRLAKLGMYRVVNTPAGTGRELHLDEIAIAGKTGTAQASPLTIPRRDAAGKLLRDDNGKVIRDRVPLSTSGNINPEAPWYRGTGSSGADIAHSWFMGFAPADKPQIAFAVLVEYGGAGGKVAGPIARDIVKACMAAGYVSPSGAPLQFPEPATPPPADNAVGMLTGP